MLEKTKLSGICDKIVLFSLYVVAFQLPISKAIVESFSILAVVFYFLKKLIQRQDVPKSPLNLTVIIYFLVCFVSIFNSNNFRISSTAFIGKITQDVFFFFAVAGTLNDEKKIKNFLYILFCSAFLLGIDGIYQHFTHQEFIRHRPDQGLPRINATFVSANDYGSYLVAVIPFSLACFFNKVNFSRISRFLILSLFILLFSCLLLTVSRGAWFAFIASVTFMSIWFLPLGIFMLALLIMIFFTKRFYHPYLKEHLNNLIGFFSSVDSDRSQIWQAGWKMFTYKPWLGLGLGTFMFNFARFVNAGYPWTTPYAHNCYLQITAETGAIGLLSFLAILVLFFSEGIEALSARPKSFFWFILLATGGALAGYCTQMVVDTLLYSLDLGILFWLLLGLGAAAINKLKLEIKPA